MGAAVKFAALILACFAFTEPAEARKKRSPPQPKVIAAPIAEKAEVKTLLHTESLEKFQTWIKEQKAEYQQRHIFYFDTKELELLQNGVILRIRRKQDETFDTTVKYRAESIMEVPRLATKTQRLVECELDSLSSKIPPYTSCDLTVSSKKILQSLDDDSNFTQHFTSDQKKFIGHYYKIPWNQLKMFGRIISNEWQLKGIEGGDIKFELWTLPNGQRILEASLRPSKEEIEKAEIFLKQQLEYWHFKTAEPPQYKTTAAFEALKK